MPTDTWSDTAIALLGRRGARRVAAAFLAYGLSGLAVLLGAGILAMPVLATVDALASAAGASAHDVVVMLDATVTAFDGFGTSLGDGQRSIESAEAAAREASTTARRLGDAMNINIFGVQPLLPLSSGFRAQSEHLASLATELDELGGSLGRNERDVATVRATISEMRDRLTTVGPLPITGAPIVPLAYAILAWLALPAAASTWAGAVIWRRATPLLERLPRGERPRALVASAQPYQYRGQQR